MADFIHACASCDARRCCEYTFGRFYSAKSSGGRGCSYKIKPFDIDLAKRGIDARAIGAEKPPRTSATASPSRAEILERLKRMRRN